MSQEGVNMINKVVLTSFLIGACISYAGSDDDFPRKFVGIDNEYSSNETLVLLTDEIEIDLRDVLSENELNKVLQRVKNGIKNMGAESD